MTRLISDAEVRASIGMDVAIAAVSEAYASAARGELDASERTLAGVDGAARLLTVAAGDRRHLLAQSYTAAPLGVDRNTAGFNRREKIYVVYDATNGECEAIIGGAYLSWLSTGAMGAVAIDRLARHDAQVLTIVGSGRQAHSALSGALAVRSWESVRVWSRDVTRAERFCGEYPDVPGIMAVEDLRASVGDSDVVITVTTSGTPVVLGEWVPPGAHINSIGAHYPDRRELDTEAVARATVFVDTFHQASREKGELLLAVEEGRFALADIRAELGEVIAGTAGWTRRPDEITLFASNGSPIESLGSAIAVVRTLAADDFASSTFRFNDGPVAVGRIR